MQKFPTKILFDFENSKINGKSVVGIIESNPIFRDARLQQWLNLGNEDCVPEKWYPWKHWLQLMYDLGPKTVYLIGREIPNHGEFPPSIYDIRTALESINIAYHTNITGSDDIGYVEIEYLNQEEKKASMVCVTPVPKAFELGLITSMCRRFLPVKDAFTLKVYEDPQRAHTSETSENGTYFTINW